MQQEPRRRTGPLEYVGPVLAILVVLTLLGAYIADARRRALQRPAEPEPSLGLELPNAPAGGAPRRSE